MEAASGVVKTGYLSKQARNSGRNWKKRYFVLNDNTLSYYADDKKKLAKGNLLLVVNTGISDEVIKGIPYAFKVSTPFESILLAADSEEDRMGWKISFIKAIDLVQNSLRGYMICGEGNGTKSRKFFVFHDNTLSYHSDHEHTTISQWTMPLCASTTISTDNTSSITISKDNNKIISIIFEERNEQEFPIWLEAFHSAVKIHRANKHAQEAKLLCNSAIKTDNLMLLAITNCDLIADRQVVVALLRKEIVLMTSASVSKDSSANIPATEVKLRIDLTSNTDCELSCEDSAGRSNCLTLKTSGHVVTLQASTAEQASDWHAAVAYQLHGTCSSPNSDEKISEANDSSFSSNAVPAVAMVDLAAVKSQWLARLSCSTTNSQSPQYTTDDMIRDSRQHITCDKFYEVVFKESKALGVVLERAGEWAMAKIADFKETGVRVGSALTSVNGELVMYDEYLPTIGRLKHWRPPLTLDFRQAPEMTGQLEYLVDFKSRLWSNKYCDVKEGMLTIKTSANDAAAVVRVALANAMVYHVPHNCIAGKHHCFRVVNGTTSITVSTNSYEELRQWSSLVCHAIDIAEGGKRVIKYEKDRMFVDEKRSVALTCHQQSSPISPNHMCIVESINAAIESRSAVELQEAVHQAQNSQFQGEFVVFAHDLSVAWNKEDAGPTGTPSKLKQDENNKVIQIELDFADGNIHVKDSVEWNLDCEVAPETFAAAICAALQLPGSFESQMSAQIVEQLQAAQEQAEAADMERGVSHVVIANDTESDECHSLAVRRASALPRASVLASTSTSASASACAISSVASPSSCSVEDDSGGARDTREKSCSDKATLHTSLTTSTTSDSPLEAWQLAAPASVEELRSLYRFYVKHTTTDGDYINVMLFSTIWRLVTRERGNLFKEMQMFNKFDSTKNGAMGEEDFVQGWLALASDTGDDEYLRRIKLLLGDDNMLL